MSYVIPDFQSKADDAFTRTHESCVLFYPDSPAIVSIFCQMFWIFSDRLMGRFRSFLPPVRILVTVANQKHFAKNYLCRVRWETVHVNFPKRANPVASCTYGQRCVARLLSHRHVPECSADLLVCGSEPRAGKTLILAVMDVTSGCRLG